VPEGATVADKPSAEAVAGEGRSILSKLGSASGVILLPLHSMPGKGEQTGAPAPSGGKPSPNALTYFSNAFRAACRPAKLLLETDRIERDGDFPLAKSQSGADSVEASTPAVSERLVQALHTYARVSLAAPAKVPPGAFSADSAAGAADGSSGAALDSAQVFGKGHSHGMGSSSASTRATASTAARGSAGDSEEGAQAGSSGLSIGKCVAMCARTDRPDGLITTVVCDLTGVAMGLVYSSVESIEKAVDDMRGVYFSRSRQGIWEKGKTSGNYQELHSIRLDCDDDAVMVRVL